MEPVKLLAVALSAFFLAGCPSMTSVIWSDIQPGTNYTEKKIEQEYIQAFGVVREKNSQLELDSIVMMGNTYWFVLEPEYTKQLRPILNAKLDKPFETFKSTFSSSRLSYDSKTSPIKAVLIEETKPEFYSKICLRYSTGKAEEANTLTQIGFKKAFETPRETVYQFCDRVNGKIYTAPSSVQQDYQFEQSFPVEIVVTEAKQGSKVPSVVGRVLLTPFGLAIDAVTAVVRIPFNAAFEKSLNKGF